MTLHHPHQQRPATTYINQQQPFTVKSQLNKYNSQYSHIYSVRLQQLKSRLLNASVPLVSTGTKIADNPDVSRLINLKDKVMTRVVGTLVVDEANLVLEDDSGRVALDFTKLADYDSFLAKLVTGVCVSVIGTINHIGEFMVEQLFTVSPAVNTARLNLTTAKLVLLSGVAESDKLEFLVELITTKLSDVSRVMLLGNSTNLARTANQSRTIRYKTLMEPLARLEESVLVPLLAAGVPCDVIPGQNDPTNCHWPQQPLSAKLFPLTKLLGDVSRTNPYSCTIDGRPILVNDGEGVRDVLSSAKFADEMDALTHTLLWSHMCPTAPSTKLATIPMTSEDPFIIQDQPSVYAIGGCERFRAKFVDGCLCVCVPSFAVTGQAILVDLNNLSCEVLSVDANNMIE